jgi:PASTA domain
MKEKAEQEVREARARLDKAIQAAYQHILYLAEGADGNRIEEAIRLDGDNESALHGGVVWAALCTKDKAFGQGQFNTQALLHQLKDSDFGKPIEEIRDAFWNTPRLPLLPSGESELRAAIYGAVNSGELALTDGAGNPYTAHSESEINLQSNAIRLVRPGAAPAIVVPNVVGMSLADANAALVSAGLVAEEHGHGTVVSQSPDPGAKAASGAVVQLTATAEPPPPTATEFQVKVSTISSIDEPGLRAALRLLVTQIANAIDGGASHIQISVEITVDEGAKQSLEQAARDANASVAVIDLS